MSVVLFCEKVFEPVTISFVGAVSLFMNCPRRSKRGLTLSGLQDSPCEVRFAHEKWSMSGTPSVFQVFRVTISCTFCSQGGHRELISFSVTHEKNGKRLILVRVEAPPWSPQHSSPASGTHVSSPTTTSITGAVTTACLSSTSRLCERHKCVGRDRFWSTPRRWRMW